MGKRIEYVEGTVYHDLTFLHEVTTTNRARKGMFRCKCGTTKVQDMNNVRLGFTRTCGCGQIAAHTKHGHCTKENNKGKGTSIHKRWSAMKYRCDNPKSPDYHRYGGRGIKVCKEWMDFNVFNQWATDSGYVEHLTIDRKNNNKGYYPNNCRWVSQCVQSANRGKEGKTQFKYIGVNQIASGNWQARLQNKSAKINVGVYPTEIEAVTARNHYIRDNNLPHTIQEIVEGF